MRMGRPRYEDILTPREWEVLALIEQGLTNEQIAQRLDISYGTAKYHVSEIISKTGAANREEAVRIARRSRRLALPALAPAWLLQGPRHIGQKGLIWLAGGSVAAIVALAVIFGGWFGGDGDPDHVGLAALQDFEPLDDESAAGLVTGSADAIMSFAFEARVAVSGMEEDEILDRIEGWYSEPERWRWEFSSTDPSRAHEGSVQVSDGSSVWLYEGKPNRFHRQDIDVYFEDLPPTLRSGPPPLIAMSIFLGPLPLGDEFFDAIGPGWRETGREMVAGHEARVIEFEMSDAQLTLWLHADFPFILRSHAKGVGGSSGEYEIDARVIEAEFNLPVDESRFVFTPPSEAQEVEPGAGSQGGTQSGSMMVGPMGDSREIYAPEGFLRPGYLPDGFFVDMQGSTESPTGTISVESRLERQNAGTNQEFLIIEQTLRPGPLPESLQQGERISVGSSEGYYSTAAGELRLVWKQGDIIVTLRTNSLPLEELLRIAESME